MVDISFLKGLKELEILSLTFSKKFGLEEIGELTRLRRLELSIGSELGIIIPIHVISNLSLLEELYIIDYSKHANKDRCNTSRSVTFPKDRLFEKLTRFQVLIGVQEYRGIPDLKLRRALCIYGNDPVEEHWVQVLLLKAEELHLGTLDLNNVFHDRDGKGFVDLEHLHIEECHHDREYILGEQKCVRFSKLSTLTITNCGLKKTVSPSNARGLLQLESLKIRDCESMDSIIGNEEHDNEEEAVDLVTFPRLRWIALWSLPDLISFYPKMKYQSTHEQNESIPVQVAIPALEILSIKWLNMKDIWNKKLREDSFCHLKYLYVRRCHNLGNVFSASTAKSLVHLKKLRIEHCSKIEEIVAIEEGPGKMDKIVFHQLTFLSLRYLPALRCFCSSRSMEESLVAGENVSQQALFSEEVAIPALEILSIKWLNMKDIWNKKLREDSFCHLKYLVLLRCHNLGNVFSASTAKSLVHLKKLKVEYCSKIEEIVAIEGPGKMDKIVFHQLTFLSLRYLPALRCFCSSRSMEESLVAGENVSQQALFSEEVAFPCLEKLQIKGLYNLTEIWQSTVPVDSFCSLRELSITTWDKLVDEVYSDHEDELRAPTWEEREVYSSKLREKHKVYSSKLRARFPTLEKCEVDHFEYDYEDSEDVDYDDEDDDVVEDVDDVEDFDDEDVNVDEDSEDVDYDTEDVDVVEDVDDVEDFDDEDVNVDELPQDEARS